MQLSEGWGQGHEHGLLRLEYRTFIAVECSFLSINVKGYEGASRIIHVWVNKSGCTSRTWNMGMHRSTNGG